MLQVAVSIGFPLLRHRSRLLRHPAWMFLASEPAGSIMFWRKKWLANEISLQFMIESSRPLSGQKRHVADLGPHFLQGLGDGAELHWKTSPPSDRERVPKSRFPAGPLRYRIFGCLADEVPARNRDRPTSDIRRTSRGIPVALSPAAGRFRLPSAPVPSACGGRRSDSPCRARRGSGPAWRDPLRSTCGG